jgi:hypothetical protein
MNSYDLAMLYYKDASRLFKWAGDPALAVAAQEEAGNLQVYLCAFPGTIVDLQEAIRLYREANIPSRSAIVDQNLELARQSHERGIPWLKRLRFSVSPAPWSGEGSEPHLHCTSNRPLAMPDSWPDSLPAVEGS